MTGTITTPEKSGPPSNPDASERRLYPKSDGWYDSDDTGIETSLLSPTAPGVQIKLSTTFSIDSGSPITVDWDDEDYDTNNYHDNVTNNNRITIPTGQDGRYLVILEIAFNSTSGVGTYRSIGIRINGSTISNVLVAPHATFPMRFTCTTIREIVATEYFDAFVQHDIGSAINISTSCRFTVQRLK